MSFFEESDQREAELLKEMGSWTLPVGIAFSASLGVIVLAPLAVWRAWVLYCIWGWYLAAIIGPASFWIAFGALLAGEVVTYRPHQRSSTRHEGYRQVAESYLQPLSLLALAWAGRFVAPYLPGIL